MKSSLPPELRQLATFLALRSILGGAARGPFSMPDQFERSTRKEPRAEQQPQQAPKLDLRYPDIQTRMIPPNDIHECWTNIMSSMSGVRMHEALQCLHPATDTFIQEMDEAGQRHPKYLTRLFANMFVIANDEGADIQQREAICAALVRVYDIPHTELVAGFLTAETYIAERGEKEAEQPQEQEMPPEIEGVLDLLFGGARGKGGVEVRMIDLNQLREGGCGDPNCPGCGSRGK